LEAVRLHGTAEEGVEETVAARVRRPEVLYDTNKTLEFVITEAEIADRLTAEAVTGEEARRLITLAATDRQEKIAIDRPQRVD
jgi:hypothetical protein